jgi:protein-disulfide isomerase
MKSFTLLLLASLSLLACQADTRHLNDRMERIEKKLDQVIAQGGRPGVAPQQRPQRIEPDRAKTYAVPIDGDPFDGPADAKVTIVKAYEYACPYCDKVRPTMEALRQKYGNELRVVSKHLVVHPNTATAPAVTFCAGARQGKAKQIDDMLWERSFKARKFDPDKCWEAEASCPLALELAQELQLDVPRFKADLKACMAHVQKDMAELQKLGVNATPSFFVNGRFLSGAMPLENFVALVDEELKKANERIQQGTPAAQYYQQWIMDKGLKQLER